MKTIDQQNKKIKNNGLEKFAIVTGLIMSSCYIVYFLLMEALGLVIVPEYRVLNFVIQITAIAISIRNYKLSLKGNFNYLSGFVLGCFASFVSTILFGAFLLFYLSQLNPELLPVLGSNASMMGKYLTPFTAAVAVVVEGNIAGLIISFILMQFYKDDALHNPLKKKSSEIE